MTKIFSFIIFKFTIPNFKLFINFNFKTLNSLFRNKFDNKIELTKEVYDNNNGCDNNSYQ